MNDPSKPDHAKPEQDAPQDGKTPGQAAYEAFHATFGLNNNAHDWGIVTAVFRGRWEAAAAGAIAAAAPAAPQTAPELARLRETAADNIALRELLAEVLDSYAAIDERGRATDAELIRWAARAGLPQ